MHLALLQAPKPSELSIAPDLYEEYPYDLDGAVQRALFPQDDAFLHDLRAKGVRDARAWAALVGFPHAAVVHGDSKLKQTAKMQTVQHKQAADMHTVVTLQNGPYDGQQQQQQAAQVEPMQQPPVADGLEESRGGAAADTTSDSRQDIAAAAAGVHVKRGAGRQVVLPVGQETQQRKQTIEQAAEETIEHTTEPREAGAPVGSGLRSFNRIDTDEVKRQLAEAGGVEPELSEAEGQAQSKESVRVAQSGVVEVIRKLSSH